MLKESLFERWNNEVKIKTQIETSETEDACRELGLYQTDYLKTVENGKVERFSERLSKSLRDKLCIHRNNLKYDPKSSRDFYTSVEAQKFCPDVNVINLKDKRKPMIDKIFKL